MTALLLAALAATPAPCRAALAEAEASAPETLARSARSLAERLEQGGAAPAGGLLAAAEALSAAAGGDPADLASGAERFRAAVRRHCALAALRPRRPASPADRARLSAILGRPEFAGARFDPGAATRRLLALWRSLLDLLGSPEAGRWAAGGRVTFFALVAAAAGYGLVWVRRRRRSRPRPERQPVESPAADLPASAAESDARAQAALASGDGRAAVRQAFLAVIAELEAAGRVPRGRTLTNGEMEARLAPPELARGFASLAGAFDRAVYGGREPAETEARRYLERARALRRAAAGAPAP